MLGKLVASGKTKDVFLAQNGRMVVIQSRDDITAGDGAKRNLLPGKGVWSTQTSVNCFRLLESAGIPTHLLRKMRKGDCFLARYVQMYGVELVVRRIATGSYLKRNPQVQEGTVFSEPVFEMFWKNDDEHDPWMIPSKVSYDLYDAKAPMRSLGRHLLPDDSQGLPSLAMYPVLDALACQVFRVLEWAWNESGVQLVDFKIECGVYPQEGRIVVADVIDNDSWRLWPSGRKEGMLDKQVYRDAANMEDVKARLSRNYKVVADMSAHLLQVPVPEELCMREELLDRLIV